MMRRVHRKALGLLKLVAQTLISLAWFTNTLDYDWWLHSAGSLLWHRSPLLLSRLSDTRFSVPLCKHLLENSKLAMGS